MADQIRAMLRKTPWLPRRPVARANERPSDSKSAPGWRCLASLFVALSFLQKPATAQPTATGASAAEQSQDQRLADLQAAVASAEAKFGQHSREYAAALTNLSGGLFGLGKAAEAEPILRRALALRIEVLGEKHPDTLSSINNLAVDLSALGRTAEAEPLLRRGLALRIEMLGEKHTDTLASLNDLGSALSTLGRAVEAEPLLRRAAALRTEVLGEKHRDTLESLNNLAYALNALGRAAEAEPLLRQVVALQTEIFGEKDPSTLTGLSNLAQVLNALGRVAEAEPLARRALALRTEVLGEKHPDTLSSLSNLAAELSALGRTIEAEPLNRRALALQIEVHGEKHPDTLTSLNNLAYTLSALGRPAEAEPLYRRLLALRTEVLGEKHPETIETLHNFATNLNDLGRAAEAEPLLRRALALNTEVLGEKHPDTLTSLNNLAYSLTRLGGAAEAEPLYRRLLALRTEVLGEKHPETIKTLHSFATNLNDLGRAAEAEPLLRRALALSTEVLGEKHPDTSRSLNNLAFTLNALGERAESELLIRRALALQTEVLGEEHPDTLTSLSNLAASLNDLGGAAEAESLNRRVLALRTKLLGEKHPNTLISLNNLAYSLTRLGRAAEAEQFDRRAWALRTEVLGEKHPDAVRSLYNLVVDLLSQPERAYLAYAPAARTAALIRERGDRVGSNVRDQSQQSRDARRNQSAFELFADAAWAASTRETVPSVSIATGTDALPNRDELERAAFGALKDAMAGSVSEAVALQAARRAAASAGIEAVAIERQRLVEEWRANDQDQSKALGEGGELGQTKLAGLRSRAQTIEQELQAIDKQLAATAPDYFALLRPSALDLAAAQKLLAKDEAILLLVPTVRGTHAMVLTREGLRWNRAAPTADDVGKAVRHIRSDITAELGKRGSAFDRKAAHQLYQALVEPVAEALAGKREVFIAGAGDLASLPFGLLVTEPPKGDDANAADLRATAWLADRFAITQIPSLQSLGFLRTLRTADRASSGDVFAGFGDPKLRPVRASQNRGGDNLGAVDLVEPGRTRSGGLIADVKRVADLRSLPGTAIELTRVAEVLRVDQSVLRLQDRDTETAVRTQDLSRTRILSFATHGLVAGEAGAAEPALVFTPPKVGTEDDDGLLTASEVTTLRLNADWVILSACNTAASDGKGEPGLSGLARAFFYAGGRSLLASHWPVRDDVAPDLIVATLKARQQNPKLSKAEALTAAMTMIRNDPSDPSRAHPAAWAPFSLVGENR